MWCPKCYGGMKKKDGICLHCGFKLSEFDGATNEKVKIARKSGKKEDILYTSSLPIDITKKRLVLYCIFLGIIGGHNYYVGKFTKAIYMTCTTIFTILMAILIANKIAVEFTNYFGTFFSLLQGITILIWLYDLICILANKFKVPVYKEEFSKRD